MNPALQTGSQISTAGSRAIAPDRRKPLPALTGVRILAAYYVVMLHTGYGYFSRHGAPGFIDNLLGNGYQAVSLFFLLSGFILAYTYEGKLKPGNGPHHAGKARFAFWKARFARIYPVYVLSLAVMVPFSRDVRPLERVAVLAMVQAWVPGRLQLIGAWNFPAWSLSVEAFFYLCFPLILPRLGKLSLVRLRYLAGCLLLLIAGANLPRPFEQWPHSPLAWVHFIPLPVLRLPEFVAGMVLGLIFLRTPTLKKSGPLSIGMALLALVLLSSSSQRLGAWAVVPFAVLIFTLAYQRGLLARLLSTNLLILLGGASYAVYLLQLPVRIYTRLFVGYLPHLAPNLDSFLSPALLLAFSILAFLFWEEPMRKFLRRESGLRPRWKWPYR